jgi:hypothetical protein
VIVTLIWPPHGQAPFVSRDRPEAVYARYPQHLGYRVVPLWIGGT